MFTAIWSKLLEEESRGLYRSPVSDIDDTNKIKISRLNLFIGANNSGKSRLIRTLLMSGDENISLSEDKLSKQIAGAIYVLRHYSLNPHGVWESPFKDKLDDLKRAEFTILKQANDWIARYLTELGTYEQHGDRLARSQAIEFFSKLSDQERNTLKVKDSLEIPDRYYIPILRGMRPVTLTEEGYDTQADPYKDRTWHDYFSESRVAIDEDNIFTGLDLYEQLTSMLLGKPRSRAVVAEYQTAISRRFFNNQEVTLIPNRENDTVEIKIGAEDQFPMYDLGDGLQQVIIISYAAYMRKDEASMFFIEEPENNMHPGLLRQLANFLIDETPHQYFVTTHSNHLLDFADFRREDVTIHKLQKQVMPNGKSTFNIEKLGQDRELLTELGVHPSSVYLANCTIWVEGITDRKYLRAYMNKYISERPETSEKHRLTQYMENYHYSFVEYQGSTLTHWNFDNPDVDNGENQGLSALRTCAKAFLIADGDIVGNGDANEGGDRSSQLKEALGDSFVYVTPGKEIENVIPPNVLVKVVSQWKKVDAEKLAASNLPAGNYFNSSNGLGSLLDQALGASTFSADSGTLKSYYKTKLCDDAVAFMNTHPDEWQLTDELEVLCQRVFGHIESSNAK